MRLIARTAERLASNDSSIVRMEYASLYENLGVVSCANLLCRGDLDDVYLIGVSLVELDHALDIALAAQKDG